MRVRRVRGGGLIHRAGLAASCVLVAAIVTSLIYPSTASAIVRPPASLTPNPTVYTAGGETVTVTATTEGISYSWANDPGGIETIGIHSKSSAFTSLIDVSVNIITHTAFYFLPLPANDEYYGKVTDGPYGYGTGRDGADLTYPYALEAGGAPTPRNDCLLGSGDFQGGTAGIAAITNGYYIVDADGQVCAAGAAKFYGDASTGPLNAPIIAIQASPDGAGYWLLAADGGIFAYGDAKFYGSTGGMPLNAPVVGMALTPDSKGYWIVAQDGGVFTFGDAVFHGSTGSMHLNQPVDGIAVAPGGNGYWLVASDGGVFTFTPDGFYGSHGGTPLNKPVIGMSGTPSGRGYALVASDGGVFTYGDAPFYGSLGSRVPTTPIVDLSPVPGDTGYYLVDAGGGVFAFGSAVSHGGA